MCSLQIVPHMNILLNPWLELVAMRLFVTSAVDIELQKPIFWKIYLCHKADFDHIKSQVTNLTDEFLTKYNSDTPIEILWHDFKSICSSCLSCGPSRIRSQRFHHSWININIKRLSNKKQRLYTIKLNGLRI